MFDFAFAIVMASALSQFLIDDLVPPLKWATNWTIKGGITFMAIYVLLEISESIWRRIRFSSEEDDE